MSIVEELSKELKGYAKGVSVIYAEDDAVLRAEFSNFLNIFFTDVRIYENGADALLGYKQSSSDIIITDILMPEMNGIELLREIKHIRPEQKCIVISAYNLPDYLVQLIDIGVDKYLLKPFDTKICLRMLHAVCKELYETAEKVTMEALILQQSRLLIMSDTIHTIAHQWRQPLSVISFAIDDILDEYDANEGVSREYLENTIDSAQKQIAYLSQTINKFSSATRPSNEKESIVFGDMVRDIDQLLKEMLSNENISFNVDCSEEASSSRLFCYANEFKNILISLIKNAKEALTRKDVKTPSISFHCTKQGSSLRICVLDNAGGVDEEVREHLFEPYMSTKSLNYSGLGLYSAKMVVEKQMDGELVYRPLQDGAEFCIVVKCD